MKNYKAILIVCVFAFLGCGNNSSAFESNNSTNIRQQEITNIEEENISELKDSDNSYVEEDDSMETIIEKISGQWISDDGQMELEIKRNGKGFWCVNYIGEAGCEEKFAIDNIVDVKNTEQNVVSYCKDCDYWFQLSGGGEFVSDVGVNILDENTVIWKTAFEVEYTLSRKN
ncbi:MAG: hypothetical protein IKZ85_10445 [Pseudobutyrivibrio sp.]|nr:hypothetical protein [Pseudobutyrivibrio sp.]